MHSLPRVETMTTTRGHGRINEDFVCIYEVYNCITSPVLCPLEKPNRKWYQTVTTPQNCIISPLWNKATLRRTPCLGSKLCIHELGVTLGKTKIFLYIYKVYNCITYLYSATQSQTGSTPHQIVSSLLFLIKLHSSAQLA